MTIGDGIFGTSSGAPFQSPSLEERIVADRADRLAQLLAQGYEQLAGLREIPGTPTTQTTRIPSGSCSTAWAGKAPSRERTPSAR